ncbi:MAG: type III pantothenate kinase [Bacteroidota bacterium]
MILSIDIGNSRTKCGAYEGPQLLWVQSIPTDQLAIGLAGILHAIPSETVLQVGWISVAGINPENFPFWQRFIPPPRFVHIHSEMALPIVNQYQTPHTLGTDRIVGVIGAQQLTGAGTPVLVIDAGTALTYDFADASGAYLGGGIAPGIRMRFEALHHFTAKLPLLDVVEDTALVGRDTATSIQSGVVCGILSEVDGIIARYRAEYGPETNIVLTGGDVSFFDKKLKNINFADANLLLRGIYHIVTQ